MLKTMLDLIQLLSNSLQMVSINDMSAEQSSSLHCILQQ